MQPKPRVWPTHLLEHSRASFQSEALPTRTTTISTKVLIFLPNSTTPRVVLPLFLFNHFLFRSIPSSSFFSFSFSSFLLSDSTCRISSSIFKLGLNPPHSWIPFFLFNFTSRWTTCGWLSSRQRQSVNSCLDRATEVGISVREHIRCGWVSDWMNDLLAFLSCVFPLGCIHVSKQGSKAVSECMYIHLNVLLRVCVCIGIPGRAACNDLLFKL